MKIKTNIKDVYYAIRHKPTGCWCKFMSISRIRLIHPVNSNSILLASIFSTEKYAKIRTNRVYYNWGLPIPVGELEVCDIAIPGIITSIMYTFATAPTI